MGERREGTGALLLRNTLANGLGRAVNAVLAIILTPFLLHRLGPAEYGVWLLATGLTFSSGYLSLAELGIQQAAVRFVAQARSRGDTSGVSAVVSTTVAVYSVLGIVLAGALAFAAGVLVRAFNIAPDLEGTATVVFLLVGLQIAADLPASGLLSLVEGAQRYGSIRVIDVGGRVAWAIGVIVAVSRGHGATALAALSLVAGLVTLAASWVAARRAEPGLELSTRHVSWEVARSIASQSSALLALRVLGIAYSQMDRAIIGVALSAAAVASYEIAFKIQSTAALAVAVAQSAVVPAAAYLGASESTHRLRELFLRGTRYATGLGVAVSLAGILLARPLLRAWVGPSHEGLAGTTRLFLVYPIVAVPAVIGQNMLVGLGRMRPVLLLNAAAVVVNLVVSVLLVRHLGVIGVIWGTVAGYTLLLPPMVLVLLREFDVGPWTWLRRVGSPVVAVVAVQLLAALVVVPAVADTRRLAVAALGYLAVCGAGVGTFLAVGMSPADRAELVKLLRRAGARTARRGGAD